MTFREDWFEAERLHGAAQFGDVETLYLLVLSGLDVNSFDDIGYTPLHYAAEGGHHAAAKLLLQQGADVNAKEAETIGDTPLAVAVQGDSPILVELLLRHGANPDIPDWMRQTARALAHRRHDEIGRQIAALVDLYCPVGPKSLLQAI